MLRLLLLIHWHASIAMPPLLQDAGAMYAKLQQLGFKAANMQLLLNASRLTIKQAINTLLAIMGSKDIVLIFFSGHVCAHGSCCSALP